MRFMACDDGPIQRYNMDDDVCSALCDASSWGGETVIIEEIINPISGSMLEIEEVDALLSEDTDECNVDDSRGPVAMFGREHLLTNKHNWIGSSNQPLTRRHTTF